MRSRRFSPGSLPALHGAFLTQRAVKGSRDLEKGRGAHVEGDQRVGIARGMRKEGRGGGGRAGVDAARGGRGDGARRVLPRRLPTRNSCLSTGVVQDEQRDRAHQPRDQEDEGRRDLPGRQLDPHVGDGEAEVHSGARVGQEGVPGHVQTVGDERAEGKDGGLEEDGAEDG